MNTRIFYFTGTGNTLAIAGQLAEQLNGKTELTPIPGTGDGPVIAGEDNIGIAFPVYCFGMPLIVERFVKRLEVKPDAYVFSFCTCGGMSGCALLQAAAALSAGGVECQAGFVFVMPSNYLPFGGAWSEKKQRKAFDQAAVKVKRLAEVVNGRKKSKIEKSLLMPFGLSQMICRLGRRDFAACGRAFTAGDGCTGCGFCARACPVGNVELKEGRPVWGDRCEQCYACIQLCPENAIENRHSAGKKRYRHPDVSVSEIIRREGRQSRF